MIVEGKDIEKDKDFIFSEPWQAELFAITLNLHEKGLFNWNSWTEKLGSSLKRDNNNSKDNLEYYFLSWLSALEGILLEKKVTELAKIAMIEKAWKEAISKTPHGTKVESSDKVLDSIL